MTLSLTLLMSCGGLLTWTSYVTELLEHIGIVLLSFLTVRAALRRHMPSSSGTDSPEDAAPRTS